MDDKIQRIKAMLDEVQYIYDNHSIYRNGIAMHDLVEVNKFLHARLVTLKDVVSILEVDNKRSSNEAGTE